MYYPAALVSAVVLPLFVVVMVPTKSNTVLRNVRFVLGSVLAVALYSAVTPQKATESAPFDSMGQGQIALLSCSRLVSTLTHSCWPEGWSQDFSYRQYCTDKAATATISHCYEVGHPHEISSFLSMCGTFNVTLSAQDFADAHNHYLEFAQDFQGCGSGKPVKLNDSDIELYRAGYDQFLGNYDRAITYGIWLNWYWIGICGLATIGTIITKFTDNFSTVNSHNIGISLNNARRKKCKAGYPLEAAANGIRRISLALKKAVLLPALFNFHKTHSFKHFLVPTRLETLILTVFLGMTLGFVFYDIRYVPGDPVFKYWYTAYLRYYAVRTSLLASSITPLLVLFGGRNNFLQWLTRWDYSTYITFHRWISRIVVVLIGVHGVCYSLYILHYDISFNKPYIIWGFLAGFGGLAILVQGLLVLRRNNYEVFLLLHIVLAALFIFGAWLHVYSLRCLGYYYVSGGVWLMDRLVRLARLWDFGFPIANVSLIDDTVVVAIPRPDHWDVVPGGHVFVHFLRPSCFWQSHPFTYVVKPKEIVLYIKAKEGVTASLHKSQKVRVSVEGSYGESTPAGTYDSAVFIAGGNGIPGIYAEAVALKGGKTDLTIIWIIRDFVSIEWFREELAELKDSGIAVVIYVTSWRGDYLPQIAGVDPIKGPSQNTSAVNGRQKSFSQVLSKIVEEPEPAILNPKVNVEDIAPDEENSSDLESLLTTKKSHYGSLQGSTFDFSHIFFKSGRPSIDEIVQEKITESPGSTCFVTCGHPLMVDSLRASVVKNIDNKEGKTVDYFEQLQVWA